MNMGAIEVTFGVPSDIMAGLASRRYERLGGIVRDTQSKQIVAWLREVGSPQTIPSLTAPLPGMMLAGAASSVLTLGMTALNFAVMTKRLGTIEQQLEGISAALEKLNDKLGF